MKRVPPAAVGVVLDPTREQVLLVKRRDIPVWVLPGGGIDEDESPEEAVCREVEEESGYRVQIVRKVAHYFPVNRLAGHTHLYECQIIGGEAETGEESAGVSFFPLNALPKDGFCAHYLWIEETLKNSDTFYKPVPGVTYSKLIWYCLSHPIWVGRMLRARHKNR